MKAPITLKITTIVEDADGNTVVSDTLERNNLAYEDLVFIQGKMLNVGVELQKAAELKARKK